MSLLIFIAIVSGWWAAVYYTEGRSWVFLWSRSLMMLPLFIVCVFVFERGQMPSFLVLYAVAAATGIWLLRDKDSDWTPGRVVACVVPNLAFCAPLDPTITG